MTNRLIATVMATAVLSGLCAPAFGADPVDWTGFYLGGNIGTFTGNAHVSDPDGPTLYGNDVTTPGFAFGLQGGYNRQIASRWVIGFEASADYLASQGNNTCLQSSDIIIGSNCKAQPQEIATFAGRLGYLTEPDGRTMIYGKGGAAWMHGNFSANPNHTFPNFTAAHTGDPITQGTPSNVSASPWGWMVGAGVEHTLSAGWSVNLGYDYLRFNSISLSTPQTMTATPDNVFTIGPGGATAGIAQDVHLVRLGLNYRFGESRRETSSVEADTSLVAVPPTGWEIDVGTRVWYSWGKYQTTNGQPDIAISRLTYDQMPGRSGELFARIDAPFKVFIKGMIGGGGITGGNMVDEDWGIVDNGGHETYSNTNSRVSGTMNYMTADIGYSFLRTATYKFGGFIGYNRYQTSMDNFGCYQNIAIAGVCSPSLLDNVNAVSQFDTWQSFRVGLAAETQITDRLKVGGEIAMLPYVLLDGLDMHKVRNVNFPISGTGQGVQAELSLSYRVTDALSLGVGGRYWSMWTNSAEQTDLPSNFFTINTERYGVFAQLSYKFEVPR
jgi:opacity protein-like surface antigen